MHPDEEPDGSDTSSKTHVIEAQVRKLDFWETCGKPWESEALTVSLFPPLFTRSLRVTISDVLRLLARRRRVLHRHSPVRWYGWPIQVIKVLRSDTNRISTCFSGAFIGLLLNYFRFVNQSRERSNWVQRSVLRKP